MGDWPGCRRLSVRTARTRWTRSDAPGTVCGNAEAEREIDGERAEGGCPGDLRDHGRPWASDDVRGLYRLEQRGLLSFTWSEWRSTTGRRSTSSSTQGSRSSGWARRPSRPCSRDSPTSSPTSTVITLTRGRGHPLPAVREHRAGAGLEPQSRLLGPDQADTFAWLGPASASEGSRDRGGGNLNGAVGRRVRVGGKSARRFRRSACADRRRRAVSPARRLPAPRALVVASLVTDRR